MHTPDLLRWIWLPCTALAAVAWAEEPPPTVHGETRPSELVWSLGMRLKMDDMSQPGEVGLRPMIGLRYGRWRTGAVDGDSWHRFGQVKTDNTLTYDWLDTREWRTSVSASIVNLQRDSTFDLFQSGRKTLRGKATIDYLGWAHWSVGLVLTQDMLGRGAGTSLSPSVTYRQALSEDSTILLSQSFSWARSDLWRYKAPLDPSSYPDPQSHWGTSVDTSLTLRQRWKPHWSWFAQIGRNHILQAGDPIARSGQINWSGQAGVVYFQR
ncbi:MAG: hypothetical protein ACKOWC_09020 [Limnohabitans sp.]